MKKEKRIPCYVVNLSLKVRTKEQAETLRNVLLRCYEKLIEEWNGIEMMKNWGKVKI